MRLIDADAFKNDIMKHMKKPAHSIFGLIAGIEEAEFLETLCKDIDKRPTIEPETEEEAYERGYTAGQMAERKTGKWTHAWGTDDNIWKCSECGFEIDTSGWVDPVEYLEMFKFCPNCGSDNREEGDRK